MTKLEILQCIVNNHNRIAQMVVQGDNAILVGDTLKELRVLAQKIQVEIDAEKEQESDNKSKEKK